MTTPPDVRSPARALLARAVGLAAVIASPAAAQITVTLGDDNVPGDQTRCPRVNGSALTATAVDGFSVSATGAPSVDLTAVQVKLSPPNAYLNVQRVEI